MALESDQDLASRLASEAGSLLMDTRANFASDPKLLAKAADRVSHEFLMAALRSARPDDTVISEEDEEASWPWPRPSRQWIVDPLDGTREYSENRSDFAVHVALVIEGRPVVGAVALPGEDLLFSTHTVIEPAESTNNPPKMLVSRTRPPDQAEAVAEYLGAELIPMGSAGAKTLAVVRGIGDLYLHSGGQYEWDSAAPVAVALSAGMHASRLNGDRIVYGRRDAWLPDLFVCRRDLMGPVMEAIKATA